MIVLFTILAGLFILLARRKTIKDQREQQIKVNYRALPDFTQRFNEEIRQFIKSSPIIPHTIAVSSSSDRYSEYFPIMGYWHSETFFLGTRYFSASGRHYWSVDQSLFWVFDTRLPALESNKAAELSQLKYKAPYTGFVSEMNILYEVFESHDFECVEVRDGRCLLIKKMKTDLFFWGVPVSSEELEAISNDLLPIMK